ncbi:reverse transcriptase [Gossypium australe]|uniref:Reverse transcriptase n=1 Tax=Gossypium australe TaxID=47621 RepID=A0A5B6W7I7_9ROSI|nr:reverse transcriptase [Gossypium australe]
MVFNGGVIDAELNNTLIILIPKFCSISLCSVIYKLVIKTGFIVGRNTTDNIVIAQEVIHSIKSCKSRKWMAIKIDLEKAYDWVQ